MYLEYFGLSQPPFKITPDTNLFYSGGNRGAILEALIYAITNGEGIVKVVGEVGTGKTMLCRMLELELADNIELVYLANPSLSPDQIPYAIAFELKLEIAASSNRLQVMNELQDYLLNKHRSNGQVVVFVEEAQSMSLASLEELRLLSNLETGQSKLLQIVLFGQPELDEMIASTEIRQLKERITYSFQLAPFNTPDIKEYLNARVRACGYRAGELFTPGSIREITRYSNGLLRRVNILADKAMLSAYATSKRQVKAEHVKMAARDSEFITPWQRWRWLAFAGVAIVALAMMSPLILPPGFLERGLQDPAAVVQMMRDETASPGADTVQVSPAVEQPLAEQTADLSQPAAAEDPHVPPVQEAPRELPDTLNLSLKSGARSATTIEETLITTDAAVEPGAITVTTAAVEPGPVIAVAEPELVSEPEPQPQPAMVREDEKLLALENIIEQQDLGVIHYTEKELSMMLEQLEKIPSESIIDKRNENGACDNCASLIYRPLFKKENL
ncbi:MAG: AAA family ATPase [Thiotrichales bacterium]|nr:AAA family ATPase [Thiotrichales bacterium]